MPNKYHAGEGDYESYDVGLVLQDVKTVPFSEKVSFDGPTIHGTVQFIDNNIVNEYGINGADYTLLDSYVMHFDHSYIV